MERSVRKTELLSALVLNYIQHCVRINNTKRNLLRGDFL
jgi:hypothetical protein